MRIGARLGSERGPGLAHLPVAEGVGTLGDHPGGRRRDLREARLPRGQDHLQRSQRVISRLERARAGGVDLDRQQPGKGRTRGEEVEQRTDRGPNPLRPVGVAAEGGQGGRDHLGAATLDSRDQRVLLAAEVRVERRRRHRGALDHFIDPDVLVAPLGGEVGEGAQRPLAVVAALGGLLAGFGRAGGHPQRLRRGSVGEQHLGRFADQLGKFALPASLQPVTGDFQARAGEDGDHLARHRRVLGGFVEMFGHRPFPDDDRLVDRNPRRRARGVGLREAHLRRGRLSDDQLRVGLEARPGPLLPAAGGALGTEHLAHPTGEYRFDRRPKAGLFVGEEGIQAAP